LLGVHTIISRVLRHPDLFLSVASRVLVIGSFLFTEQPSAEHHAIVKDDVYCLSIPKR